MIHLFGDKLRDLRKSKNLSQEELGRYLGTTNSSIYNWEIGRSQPSMEIIVKLAEYFNVTTDYLLGLNQDDMDNIERLKVALKEAGMLNNDNEDMTKEDFEKAMQIVAMLKERKDTNQ